MNKLLFVTYDGIKNSVFQSQVLTPLLKQLKQHKNLTITLVSFEKQKPSKTLIKQIKNSHTRFNIIILKKLAYFGKISLHFAIPQLKKVIKQTTPDKIMCRGPLAGFITRKAIKDKNIPVTIQARGLCAQEYRFATQYKQEGFLKRTVRRIIFRSLEHVEQWVFVYNKKLKPLAHPKLIKEYKRSLSKKSKVTHNVSIEAVSPALKNYLIKHFHADPECITIASQDFPEPIDEQIKKTYKKEIRKKLHIPQDTCIYCYAGSAKPWQCIEESIDYFSNKLKTNKHIFLLLLSQDKEKIENIIQTKQIPQQKYKIFHIPPQELTKYLCACNYGFLFRKKDVINFVSRPTKMLEYQAANLEIIHNQTVAWLMEHPFQSQHVDQF
jgi:hypothetical protein